MSHEINAIYIYMLAFRKIFSISDLNLGDIGVIWSKKIIEGLKSERYCGEFR